MEDARTRRRLYLKQNEVHIKQMTQNYRQRNREKRRSWDRQYKEKHRQVILVRNRLYQQRYRQKHKGELKEKNRDYRARCRERLNQKAR